MSPEIESGKIKPEEGKIYLKIDNGTIKYLIRGMTECDKIERNQFGISIPESFEGLQEHKQRILGIITAFAKIRVRFKRAAGAYMFQVVDGYFDSDPKRQDRLQREFTQAFSTRFGIKVGNLSSDNLCSRQAPGPFHDSLVGTHSQANAQSIQQTWAEAEPKPMAKKRFQACDDQYIDCYTSSLEAKFGKEKITKNISPSEHKQDVDTLIVTGVVDDEIISESEFGLYRVAVQNLPLQYRARQIDKTFLFNHAGVPENDVIKELKKQLVALDEEYGEVIKSLNKLTLRASALTKNQSQVKDNSVIVDANNVNEAKDKEKKRDQEWEKTVEANRKEEEKLEQDGKKAQEEEQRFLDKYDMVINNLIAASNLTDKQKRIYKDIRHDFAMRTQRRMMTCVTEVAANNAILRDFEHRPYVTISWDGVERNEKTQELEAIIASFFVHFPTPIEQVIRIRLDGSGSMDGDKVQAYDEHGKPITYNRYLLTMKTVEGEVRRKIKEMEETGEWNCSFDLGVFHKNEVKMLCHHLDGKKSFEVENFIKKGYAFPPDGETPLCLSLAEAAETLLLEASKHPNRENIFLYFTDGAASDPYPLMKSKDLKALEAYWEPLAREDEKLFKQLQEERIKLEKAIKHKYRKYEGDRIDYQGLYAELHTLGNYASLHQRLSDSLKKKPDCMYRLHANYDDLHWNIPSLVKKISEKVNNNNCKFTVVALGRALKDDIVAEKEAKSIPQHLGGKFITLVDNLQLATAGAQIEIPSPMLKTTCTVIVNPEFGEDVTHNVTTSDYHKSFSGKTNRSHATAMRIPMSEIKQTEDGNYVVLFEVKIGNKFYQFTQKLPHAYVEQLKALPKDSKVRERLAKTALADELMGIDLDAALGKQFPTAEAIKRGLDLVIAAKETAVKQQDRIKVEYLSYLQDRFELAYKNHHYQALELELDQRKSKNNDGFVQVADELAKADKALQVTTTELKAQEDRLLQLINDSATPEFQAKLQGAKDRQTAIESELKQLASKVFDNKRALDIARRKSIDEIISCLGVMKKEHKYAYPFLKNTDQPKIRGQERELEAGLEDKELKLAGKMNDALCRFRQINREKIYSPYTLEQLDKWILQASKNDFADFPPGVPQTATQLQKMRDDLAKKVQEHAKEKNANMLLKQGRIYPYTFEEIDAALIKLFEKKGIKPPYFEQLDTAVAQAGEETVEFMGKPHTAKDLLKLRNDDRFIAFVIEDGKRLCNGCSIGALTQNYENLLYAVYELIELGVQDGAESEEEVRNLIFINNWLRAHFAQLSRYYIKRQGEAPHPHVVFEVLAQHFSDKKYFIGIEEKDQGELAQVRKRRTYKMRGAGSEEEREFAKTQKENSQLVKLLRDTKTKLNPHAVDEDDTLDSSEVSAPAGNDLESKKSPVRTMFRIINPEEEALTKKLKKASDEVDRLTADSKGDSPEIRQLKDKVLKLKSEQSSIEATRKTSLAKKDKLIAEREDFLKKEADIQRASQDTTAKIYVSAENRQKSIERAAARFAVSIGILSPQALMVDTPVSLAVSAVTPSPDAGDRKRNATTIRVETLESEGVVFHEGDIPIPPPKDSTQLMFEMLSEQAAQIKRLTQIVEDGFENVEDKLTGIEKILKQNCDTVEAWIKAAKSDSKFDAKLELQDHKHEKTITDEKEKAFYEGVKEGLTDFFVTMKYVADEKWKPDTSTTQTVAGVLVKGLDFVPLPFMGLLKEGITMVSEAADKANQVKKAKKVTYNFKDNVDLISEVAYQLLQEYSEPLKYESEEDIKTLAGCAVKCIIHFILDSKNKDLPWTAGKMEENVDYLLCGVREGRSSKFLHTHLKSKKPGSSKTKTDHGFFRSSLLVDGNIYVSKDKIKKAAENHKNYVRHRGKLSNHRLYTYFRPASPTRREQPQSAVSTKRV